jgi:hypothetical protein
MGAVLVVFLVVEAAFWTASKPKGSLTILLFDTFLGLNEAFL